MALLAHVTNERGRERWKGKWKGSVLHVMWVGSGWGLFCEVSLDVSCWVLLR